MVSKYFLLVMKFNFSNGYSKLFSEQNVIARLITTSLKI